MKLILKRGNISTNSVSHWSWIFRDLPDAKGKGLGINCDDSKTDMPRILIFDDDQDLLEMVGTALTVKGYDVCLVHKAQEFFDTIKEFRPNLVLLDIFLGEADGRELCRKIKNSESYNKIPVLLYSAGFVSNASIESCGADDFLLKPFDLNQLHQKISVLA